MSVLKYIKVNHIVFAKYRNYKLNDNNLTILLTMSLVAFCRDFSDEYPHLRSSPVILFGSLGSYLFFHIWENILLKLGN